MRAQHVEDHRAFIFDDGAVVAGVGSETRGLRNRGGIFAHQSADGEVINHTSFRFGGETVPLPQVPADIHVGTLESISPTTVR